MFPELANFNLTEPDITELKSVYISKGCFPAASAKVLDSSIPLGMKPLSAIVPPVNCCGPSPQIAERCKRIFHP
jgi:hypothetical protein